MRPYRHALVVIVVATAAGCAPSPTAAQMAAAAPPPAGSVSALVVAPDGPATGYSRAQFGAVGWPTGPDGCSVRDEILARDLTNVTRRGRCYITAGTLADPYSGQTITGPARTDEVDHIEPLALAWREGAASWTPEQRAAFAVDPVELQTTTHTMNDAKGDRGPEAWAPVAADQCRYARAFTAVAVKYHLTVTAARRDALNRMLAGC